MLNKAIKKAKENKKGFTLAELLIVVAIIAVLVAISIPIFTTQLEKSREATDAANIRAAYAQASVEVLEGEADVTYKVNCVQTTAGFEKIENKNVGGVDLSSVAASKTAPVYVTVHADGTDSDIDTTAPNDVTAKEFN